MTTLQDFSKTCVLIGNDVDTSRPEGEASNIQITINGSGFGNGPNVILFDSFSGGNAGSLINLQTPEVGGWAGENALAAGAVSGAEYYEYNGRNWMTGRKLSEIDSNVINLTGLRYDASLEFSEFRFSYRQVLPIGRKFCGCELPNTTNNSGSNWKPHWFGHTAHGNAVGASGGEPDMIIPTNGSAGGVWVSGNNVNPEWYDYDEARWRSAYVGRSGTEEDLFTYYQKPETSHLGTDGVMEFGNSNATAGWERKHSDQATIWQGQQGVVSPKELDMFLFNGWMGNGSAEGYDNIFPLMTDAYLAIGANSRACLVISDAATLATSTKFAIIPPDSWSDTTITATKRPHEAALTFNHLILADGTQMENV